MHRGSRIVAAVILLLATAAVLPVAHSLAECATPPVHHHAPGCHQHPANPAQPTSHECCINGGAAIPGVAVSSIHLALLGNLHFWQGTPGVTWRSQAKNLNAPALSPPLITALRI